MPALLAVRGLRVERLVHMRLAARLCCDRLRPGTTYQKRGSERGGRPKDIRALHPHQMAAWFRSLCDGVGRFINGDTKAM